MPSVLDAMKKLIPLFFLLVVAIASVSAQPGRLRQKPVLGLLPFVEQSNLKGFDGAFITQLKASLKGTGVVVMTPKETLARFKKAGIDPRKFVTNPKALTDNAAGVGAMLAWWGDYDIGKGVVIGVIDATTGEILISERVKAAGRNDAKAAAKRLAAAIRKRTK